MNELDYEKLSGKYPRLSVIWLLLTWTNIWNINLSANFDWDLVQYSGTEILDFDLSKHFQGAKHNSVCTYIYLGLCSLPEHRQPTTAAILGSPPFFSSAVPNFLYVCHEVAQ